ncbi:MAG: tetratricopeptide repeat protein [Lachnospiraceae bacterium]|nr:tetratricopeptide repeat protein [Lachnospiraceae bacterium]
MTIPVDKLGEATLAVFESIFASKICEFQNKKISLKYFDELDESILSCINDKIKDEYELEKTQDFIQQNPLFLEQKYQFIDNDAKNNFIDSFYKKNPDLRSIGSKRINQCLETYIDKLNELLNNLLSAEGKIIVNQINTTSSKIINEIHGSQQEIKNEINNLKEIISSADRKPSLSISPFYNIPRKNSLFFGREKTLSDLTENMTEYKLSFLTGPGGIGKSQIAREYVIRSINNNKYKSIFLFTAASENELLEEFNKVALYFDLLQEKCENSNRLMSILSSFIGNNSPSLVIYDGLDDTPIDKLVEKYFFQNSDIIVTTQNSNIDADEFPVIQINNFELEESKAFLLKYTNKRMRTKSDNETVLLLANTLENYPLALEYARAYVNKTQISFSNYLEIYSEHKLNILSSPITSYKKTAYTAWKISFEKILHQSSNAKDLLNIVSLLDSYDIPIYNIFLHNDRYSQYDFEQTIIAITEYSLFTINKRMANIHSITQAFIRKQMCANNEYQKYFEETLSIINELLPRKITNCDERELANLFTKHALKLLSYCNDFNNKNALSLAGNTVSKLYILGKYTDVTKFINKYLQNINIDNLPFTILEMIVFYTQSFHYLGNDAEALHFLTLFSQKVQESTNLSDNEKWYLLSIYKNVNGIIQKDCGHSELSLNSFLEEYNYLGKITGMDLNDQIANVLDNIANIFRNQNNMDEAFKYYNKALFYAGNEKHQLLRIYGNIGFAYKQQSLYNEALDYINKSLDYSIEIGDKRNECISLQHLGNCYICLYSTNPNMEYLKSATSFLDKAMKLANEINLPIQKACIYYDYASIAFHKKDKLEAHKLLTKSLEISTSINYQKGIDLVQNALSSLK